MHQYTPNSHGSHVWLHIHLHLSPCLHAIAAMAAIFMSAGPPLRARDFLTENLIKRIQDPGFHCRPCCAIHVGRPAARGAVPSALHGPEQRMHHAIPHCASRTVTPAC